MHDWYGVWGLVGWSGEARHAIYYDHETDRHWTICAHGGRWRSDKRDVEVLASDSPLMERPPCHACVNRLKWTATWWITELNKALEALRTPAS